MGSSLKIALAGAVAVATMGSTAVAWAYRDHPPGAHVQYRGEWLQRADASADCWPGEDGGIGCGEVDPQTWPKARRVRDDALVRFRINVNHKPRRVWVRSYRAISKNGEAKDRGKRIEVGLRPVRRDDRVVAWDAAFRLHAHRTHYLHVIANCPYTAAWNATLRVR